MQYHPTADQRELAASLEDAISALLPVTRWHEQKFESAAIWDGLTELGLFDMARAEAEGGLGLGAAEEMLIALQLGRQLASPAIFATLAAVHAQGGGTEARGRVQPAIKSQNGITIAHDPAGEAILLYEAGAATLHRPADGAEKGQTLAGNPWIEELAQIQAVGAEIGQFDALSFARVQLIWAAGLAGLAEGALNLATEYAKIREQFGRPIGSFQAVKHHCANMLVAARSASDMVTFAATALDEGRDEAQFLAESALVVAAEAAKGNSALNVQIHGGIGFSSEAEPHLYAKKAQLLTALLGGTEAVIERLTPPPAANAA